jgi:hypothetical protein
VGGRGRAVLLGLVALGLASGCKPRATLSTPLDLDSEPASAVPSAEEFVEALPAAIAAPDYAALEPLCSARYAADPNGCKAIWDQASRKGFALQPADRQVVVRGDEGRLVLTMDVISGGRTVDRIFAYATGDAQGWRLGGIDEIREHAAPFLEGKIGPHVDVEALPADPALDALGQQLAAAAHALDGDPERLIRGGARHRRDLGGARRAALRSQLSPRRSGARGLGVHGERRGALTRSTSPGARASGA